MLDIPVQTRGSGLGLGRYYVILLESEQEIVAMERELAAPRPGPVRPEHFDRQTSGLASAGIVVARYDPPSVGWPWLSVCRWPPTLARTAAATGVEMARDCYTMEAFETLDALDAHHLTLLTGLSQNARIDVRMITADSLSPEGHS